MPDKKYYYEPGQLSCSINNLGFRRTVDTQYLKPADTFRIFVLGGSAVFAGRVLDSETWVSLLETKLRDTYSNKTIEVINAGVPGYSVFDSKVNYLYRLRAMSPDAVLVSHAWNDIKFFRSIEAGTVFKKGPYRKKRPSNIFSSRMLKSSMADFHLYRMIRHVYRLIYLKFNPHQAENTFSAAATKKASKTAHIPDGSPAHRWERQNYNDLALILKSDNVLPIFANQAVLLSEKNLDDPQIQYFVRTYLLGLNHADTLKQLRAVTEIIRDVSAKHGNVFIDVNSQSPHDLYQFAFNK